MSYFTELKIKHVDNRYIFYPVILIAAIIFACYHYFGIQLAVLVAIPLVLLIVLSTIFHVYRGVIEEIRFQDARTQALFNIHSMIEADLPIPYLTGWAAFPELINAILTEVKGLNPNHILEIGSGSSTILTSYMLKDTGSGRITSLDHDNNYGLITKSELFKRGLSDQAKVVFSPLVNHEIDGLTYSWYDISKLDLENMVIDMLVIDGPPVQTNKHARYPALPLFYKNLSEKAVVILDDAGRSEEKEIVEMWLKEYPEFKHVFIPTEKGISVLKRGF